MIDHPFPTNKLCYAKTNVNKKPELVGPGSKTRRSTPVFYCNANHKVMQRYSFYLDQASFVEMEPFGSRKTFRTDPGCATFQAVRRAS